MQGDGLRWVLFDLDGTLADTRHRVHLALEKRWDEFNAAGIADPSRGAECAVLRTFASCKHTPYAIAICTGRSEAYREPTARWLRLHHLPFQDLMMRPDGDHRPDVIIKHELAILNHPERRYLFVVEDRDKVVEMWRANGLTCLQCQPGAY